MGWITSSAAPATPGSTGWASRAPPRGGLGEPVAAAVRVRRALPQAPAVRRYTEIRYGAKSWHGERRVAARIEATAQGLARISHRSHVHRGSESAKVLLQQSLAAKQRRSPMPTQCTPARFDFSRVEGRAVVAAFDGGRITSDAGALLLGATDRVIGLTRRFAACFK